MSIDEGDLPDRDVTPPLSQRPKRANAGAGVERLEMGHGTKEYASVKNVQLIMKNGVKYSIQDRRDILRRALHVILTQMSANEGIRKFGQRAVSAMIKELKQLDEGAMPGKPAVAPIDPDLLSKEEKSRALDAVNLIKQKRNGNIKGRTCANGAKQRRYVKEGEIISSPTASLESIIATLVIDAYEERYSVIADVPGAYLHAEMPPNKRVLLKLKGQFVDIMCKVNPEYQKYVRYEGRTKVLYLKVLRAIYGCLESALLWYNLYSTTLKNMGFVLNPYDLCVANKTVNGSQCTVVFYVDDNKVSHKEPGVVDEVINELKKHFGELTVETGPEFNFLGMNVKMRKDKKIEIEMKNQILEAIEWLDEDLTEKPNTPANKNLFNVTEESISLNDEKSDVFHSIVAKLLYITKRARPDVETAISFLCRRVSKSTMEDWKKLRRVLAYLKNTINDIRIIGANNLQEVYTWVDAAYGVHDDMRSHTGGVMSLGVGTIHKKSSVQKLNVKSSTEAELVGTSEYMPYNIWFYNFMEAQGYKVSDNILFQDNQSAMKMEINGRRSCTGNSRHVNIRHFFVKDLVDKKQVRVVYCPTGRMLADFYTKPVQGELFRFFRSIVMGHTSITEVVGINDEMKERVSKWEKYEEIFFSSIKDSNTVGEMEKIEKCSNTERSEFLLKNKKENIFIPKDKKENIFIPKDKNIPLRTCEYRKSTDGKNILDGRKPFNDMKRQNNVIKDKISAIVPSIRTYADVVNNKMKVKR